jgi:hypothetical protein
VSARVTSRRVRWVVSLMATLALLSGCAAFVSKQEYADYRAVRLERNESARLRAMQRYVSRNPQGRWYGDLQLERRARDQAVFESGRSTRPGLELYLAAFPDGLFVAQAQARLSAIAVIEQRQRQDAARAAQLAEVRKQAEAERNRTWVSRFVGYWSKTLLGLGGWGLPIEQVARGNADFSRAFGRPPRPRCTADECVKYYDSPYGVPIPGGTRLERTMRLLLRLRLQQGRLVRAELLLPSWGFSRWLEVEERKPVVDADPTSRAQALQAVFGRLLPMIDQLAPGREAIDGYKLAALAAPAIGPSGELVDTSVEDPSAPANRIQGQAAGTAEDASPSVEQLLKPEAPEQPADMELAPLRIGPDGRPLPAGGEMVVDPLVVPPSGAAGGEMVLDPLAVPPAVSGTAPALRGGASSGGAATPGATATPGAPAPAAGSAAGTATSGIEPGLTRAFRFGNLRIVLFAAPTDAKAPAYDAIVIEALSPANGAGTKKPAKAPGKATPAATPAPAAKPPAALH